MNRMSQANFESSRRMLYNRTAGLIAFTRMSIEGPFDFLKVVEDSIDSIMEVTAWFYPDDFTEMMKTQQRYSVSPATSRHYYFAVELTKGPGVVRITSFKPGFINCGTIESPYRPEGPFLEWLDQQAEITPQCTALAVIKSTMAYMNTPGQLRRLWPGGFDVFADEDLKEVVAGQSRPSQFTNPLPDNIERLRRLADETLSTALLLCDDMVTIYRATEENRAIRYSSLRTQQWLYEKGRT